MIWGYPYFRKHPYDWNTFIIEVRARTRTPPAYLSWQPNEIVAISWHQNSSQNSISKACTRPPKEFGFNMKCCSTSEPNCACVATICMKPWGCSTLLAWSSAACWRQSGGPKQKAPQWLHICENVMVELSNFANWQFWQVWPNVKTAWEYRNAASSKGFILCWQRFHEDCDISAASAK